MVLYIGQRWNGDWWCHPHLIQFQPVWNLPWPVQSPLACNNVGEQLAPDSWESPSSTATVPSGQLITIPSASNNHQLPKEKVSSKHFWSCYFKEDVNTFANFCYLFVALALLVITNNLVHPVVNMPMYALLLTIKKGRRFTSVCEGFIRRAYPGHDVIKLCKVPPGVWGVLPCQDIILNIQMNE